MSKELSLALRLKYDGKAVTDGAQKNVRDLNAMSKAAASQIDTNKHIAATTLTTEQAHERAKQSVVRYHNEQSKVPSTIARQSAANQHLVSSQRQVSSALGETNRELNQSASAYNAVSLAISGLIGTGGAVVFAKDTAAAQSLDIRLKSLTNSVAEYQEVQRYLFETSDRLNTQYTTLADSYSKILNLQQSGVVTMGESRSILEGMANAAATFGASNVQLEQSLFGMTQGLTAGVLRAEELNQVTEPLPGLLQKLDKAAGVAAGGFRQLVNDGQVTSNMFKQYLISALNEYAGAAEQTEGKINASFAEMTNEYQRLVRKYEEPVNFAVTGILDAVTGSMSALRENEALVDGLTTTATGLAIVLGGHLVASLASTATGFVSKAVEANRALVADAALAKQQLNNAAAEHQHSLAMQAKAQHAVKLVYIDQQRTAALAALSTANSRATITQNALTAATNTYAIAAARASIAARGASAVLGLFGGPVGLAVTAGLGLAYFAMQSGEASKGSKDLEIHLYDLTKAFDSLNNASAMNQIERAQKQVANYTTNIEKAYQKLAVLKQRQANTADDRTQFMYRQQIADVQRYINEQTNLRAEQMKVAQSAANLSENLKKLEWSTTPEKQNTGKSELPENIRQLQQSLLGEEARIKASYENRKQMVERARATDTDNKVAYEEILKNLDKKYAEDIKDLHEKREAEKTRIQNQGEEKRRNDLRAELENRIAVIKGFADREALSTYENELAVEQARQQARVDAARRSALGLAANDDVGELTYNTDNQIRDIERNQELLQAEGFHSEREKQEYAHQERLMQIRTKNTGALQEHLMKFANWEKQNAAEKADAVLGLGAEGLKALGQQSKTAFKLYKAFAISQALIKTYESATSAYAALAPIPVVGPALGAAAAAAAVAMGMAQVRQIKAQQPAGIAHGGLDYVPNESTYILQRGERVLSPRQNQEISAMARHYNADDRAKAQGGNMSVNITNQINVTGASNEPTRTGVDIGRAVEHYLVNDFNSQGPIFRAFRSAAA
jgi:tape measure domain-containing protein